MVRVAMKISELRDGMRRTDIEGIISDIPEPRTVTLRTGQQARVADCILQDASGTITLSLWNDDIDKVEVGSKVKIENGYTNSFRGEVRLNVGRYGHLIILE
ncbi:MAG: OB-fold nucleic acid binding domain-containing protein [Candidatus Methylarchaceae archaeon HK01B]|nr:OB-fold nucleic acid binding domain-containing protein [Candidatus Methylarchaceae archaeon HK01B]